MNTLEYSTLKEEGSLNVSKWIKIPLLIDEEEMISLMDYIEIKMGTFNFYNVQGLVNQDEGISTKETFLSCYKDYVLALKQRQTPDEAYKKAFSHVLSVTPKALYATQFGNKRLIKARLPVVQMQANHINYSKEDGAFRVQVFGEQTISWGVLIGYPFLFQDPKTLEIIDVHELPNTPLFKVIQEWIRQNTRPTPFLVDGKKSNEPIRLGKACFEWINRHPQLKEFQVVHQTDPAR